MQKVKGKLVLQDGTVFEGMLHGQANTVGEVVFTTGMCGYEETLSDPTYCDQIIVMTYPMVGAYGCNDEFMQSAACQCQGMVVGQMLTDPSNWKAEESLPAFVERMGVPVLEGIDTRAITRKLVKEGTMRGVLVPANISDSDLAKLLETEPKADQVARVTTKEAYTVGTGSHKVVVLDLGVKRTLLAGLAAQDMTLTVVPAATTAEAILAMNPAGVVISNGPGNPADLAAVQATVGALVGKAPMLAVGLGHQLLALSQGGTVTKMLFGQRSNNHPVKNLAAKNLITTVQNHGYTVKATEGMEVTHISLNDASVEGITYPAVKAMGVQYHPDTASIHNDLYQQFVAMMEGK